MKEIFLKVDRFSMLERVPRTFVELEMTDASRLRSFSKCLHLVVLGCLVGVFVSLDSKGQLLLASSLLCYSFFGMNINLLCLNFFLKC